MRFRAEDLRLQRFLSHQDTTLRLAKRGVVLLNGTVLGSGAFDSNGAGKTALLPDALLFALYGRTLRGAAGKSVVTDKRGGGDGKNCLVTLTGWDGEAPVTIKRPQNHKTLSKPSIQIGNETYVGDDEVRRVLGLLLGHVDFRTFASVLVFGKGDTEFFTQQTDSERKHVLGNLLHFAELDSFHKATKEAIDARDIECIQLTNASVANSQTLEALDRAIARMQIEVSQGQANRTRKYAMLTQQLKEYNQKIEQAKQQLVIAQVSFATHKKKQNKLDNLEAEAQTHALNAYCAVQQSLGALAHAREKVELRGAAIAHATTLTSATCPTCRQAVNKTTAEKLKKLLLKELQEAKVTLRQSEEDLDRLTEVHKAADVRRNVAYQARVDGFNKTRAAELSVQTLTNAVRSCESQIAQIVARCQEAASAQDADASKIDAIAQQRVQVQESLDATQKKLALLTRATPYDQYWKVGFGPTGIRSMMLDERLPELNDAAQQYSEGLTDGEIQVRFNTQSKLASGESREKFAVEVMIQGFPTTYELCSDGQRRRVDVITTLALSDLAAKQVGGPFNVLVLDEVFDGLDATGMERAVQLLMAMGRESIFVVTHAETMASLFTSVETVEYENGISTLRV